MAQRSKEHLKNGWAAGVALREESPTIVRHLADGCPTCTAGLQLFHRTGADAMDTLDAADTAINAREQFEKALAAGLASTASPVQALHGALADLVVHRKLSGLLEG